MSGAERGAAGERLAAAGYEADGYHILAMNYRTRQGEVDIVAEKDGLYVFAEVKARAQRSIAAPREWVDAHKQRRVILAAQAYLAQHELGDVFARFDVVEVIFDQQGAAVQNRIENAFEL